METLSYSSQQARGMDSILWSEERIATGVVRHDLVACDYADPSDGLTLEALICNRFPIEVPTTLLPPVRKRPLPDDWP